MLSVTYYHWFWCFGLLTVKKKEEKKKLSFFRVFCIFNCNVAVVFMLTQCGILDGERLSTDIFTNHFFFSSSHSV